MTLSIRMIRQATWLGRASGLIIPSRFGSLYEHTATTRAPAAAAANTRSAA